MVPVTCASPSAGSIDDVDPDHGSASQRDHCVAVCAARRQHQGAAVHTDTFLLCPLLCYGCIMVPSSLAKQEQAGRSLCAYRRAPRSTCYLHTLARARTQVETCWCIRRRVIRQWTAGSSASSSPRSTHCPRSRPARGCRSSRSRPRCPQGAATTSSTSPASTRRRGARFSRPRSVRCCTRLWCWSSCPCSVAASVC
jgi:hypothetical protein